MQEVAILDEKINEAFYDDNEELAEKLYNEQCNIVKKIEDLGIREEFDNYIINL